MPSIACEESRIRSTIFSPNSVGQVLTRKSMARVFDSSHLDAAVLRHAALGDVEARHDLEARDDLAGQLHRRLGDFLQHAVDAQAHAEHLFVGLEVDVRGAAADGIEHDLVDEAHDRARLRRRRGETSAPRCPRRRRRPRARRDRPLIVAEAGHRGVGLLHRLVDELLQLVVFDHDRIDAQAGLELDLIDGVQVGRIGDARGTVACRA